VIRLEEVVRYIQGVRNVGPFVASRDALEKFRFLSKKRAVLCSSCIKKIRSFMQ
jgi:hypothetical protein